MKITQLSSNECGGFQKPKGHLDTQMYPECEGTPTDRNIVQKTVKNRKHKKTKKVCAIDTNKKQAFNLSQYRTAHCGNCGEGAKEVPSRPCSAHDITWGGKGYQCLNCGASGVHAWDIKHIKPIEERHENKTI